MVTREQSAASEEAPIVARLRACFLGGAVGDALGAAVEFMRRSEILATYGPDGIRDMAPCYGRVGGITDDTQMALFTAEGLIRAGVRAATRGICHPPSVISYAYQRWLFTQDATHSLQKSALTGWLIEQKALFSRRAPGNTCLSALRAMQQSGQAADNDSKGCGGVMRVAPVGMFFAARDAAGLSNPTVASISRCFELGCDAAKLTHGHPTGYLSAGAFAVLIYLLLSNRSLNEACDGMLDVLEQQPSHEETSSALRNARRLARECPSNPDAFKLLGEGWVAEEALAIGLYCALCATDFEDGVARAVNHDGDSDSTGLIAGHILGALEGPPAIPPRWLEPLELRAVIAQVSADLATAWQLDFDADRSAVVSDFIRRYPGS